MFYLIMVNAPIHTANEVDDMVVGRGYRCVYLPPYSPGHNPIEQFWAIVTNKVRRSQFGDREDLRTRIAKADNNAPAYHLRGFIQHSVDTFQKCLNNEPI
jgi:transposase